MKCSVIPYAAIKGVCDKCGKKLDGQRKRWCSKRCSNAYRREHRWTDARAAAKRRDKYTCVRCGAGREADLEVNHIKPRNGKGYGWGCHHHLSGLETLCHYCHVLVTRQQRAERKRAA